MPFGFFKKKSKEEKQESNESRYLTLKVKEVKSETPDAVSVYFNSENSDFNYQSGQFITLIKSINGKKVRRAYSLCTSPFTDPVLGISVKRVKGGVMSNFINDNLKAGEEIEIMMPMGQFTTDYATDNLRHAVLIAGGSGITPLLSILKSILHNEPKSHVSLIYANEKWEDVIFKEELQSLEKANNGRLKITHVLNQPPADWKGYTGWLSAQTLMDIQESLTELRELPTEYFTCGPAPMMDIVINTYQALGVEKSHIKFESFEAGKTSPKEIIDESTSSSGKSVTVVLDGEEYTYDVAANKTILEEGLSQDIDLPYSCQSGLCTACRGKLEQGEVEMGEYDGLSQQELEDGYVLCCQAFPKTDNVRIVIG